MADDGTPNGGNARAGQVEEPIPALVLLYLAGASLGVRLDATQWLEMTGLLLIGLAPFVVIGIALGHLLTVEAMVPAVGGVVVLFALLGGGGSRTSRGSPYVIALP